MTYKCEKTIAVLLATFNGERYLIPQLDSLMTQSNQDFNIYIHDDASTDNTKNILNKYRMKYPDRIFIIEGDKTGGAKNNFFYLMRSVDARYYMFSDQDDFWKKNKIEKSLTTIQSMENRIDEPLLAYSDLEIVDASLNLINPSMNKVQKLDFNHLTFNRIMCQNPITGCTIIINKKLNELALRYKNIENIIMHDWWIAMIASKYGKILYCNESLIKYRQHNNNTVGAFNPNNIKYLIKKLSKIKSLKEPIEKTRIQAQEFYNTFGLEENKLAYEFSNLAYKPKYQRILFYIKNDIWKTGLIRNIGFIILG